MTAWRFVVLATTSAALLLSLAGCLGPTSQVAPVAHHRTSDLAPFVDPEVAPGTLEGEVRRGSPLPADEEGLDPTTPWPDVRVDILDASGQQVAMVMSDAQGLFRVDLAPGSYFLMPHWPVTQLHRLPDAMPNVGVTVMAGAAVTVRLVYDPGIF